MLISISSSSWSWHPQSGSEHVSAFVFRGSRSLGLCMCLLLFRVHDVHGYGRGCDRGHDVHVRGIHNLGLNMYLLVFHGHDVRGCDRGHGHDGHDHGRLHSQDNRRCLCQHLRHNRFLPYDQIRLSQYFFGNLLIIVYHNAFHLYNEFHYNLD